MYIAMNHFRVQAAKTEDFERAWRERKSYLSEVPGFSAFSLLRGPPEEDGSVVLYASHTVWADEAAFLAWTQSEAFQKAHAKGGKTAAFLQGPPRFVGWTSVL